ncbi:hypothetical protein [Paraburkholderia nemoris]|uniref:bestrophin-like domain n=1 Tax=Paraburkholderia nemoris TaxID=2793076 RepID=UPI001B12D262|nr:hypothetical protein [Paraburkholderia nemoris]CAE6807119.1 hypothetical protein LMG22931_05691 [Paraburkholderia nemoris]
MSNATDYPWLVFAASFFVLWLSARIGATFVRRRKQEADTRKDFGVILVATLALLGLVIGFGFSIAISQYDLRKSYEETEANAIGTEYVRADLLPAADAAKLCGLLSRYLDQRVLFCGTRDALQLQQLNTDTAQLQTDLWFAVRAPAAAQPTPVVAIAVSGMNDVLNSEGYAQAAWRSRIPISAWCLMAAVAICCNALVGYGVRNRKAEAVRLLTLPLVVSISFMLIADIDSPRAGIIRVNAQHLISLAESLHSH